MKEIILHENVNENENRQKSNADRVLATSEVTQLMHLCNRSFVGKRYVSVHVQSNQS